MIPENEMGIANANGIPSQMNSYQYRGFAQFTPHANFCPCCGARLPQNQIGQNQALGINTLQGYQRLSPVSAVGAENGEDQNQGNGGLVERE